MTVHPRHAAAHSHATGGQCVRAAPLQLASLLLAIGDSLRGRARGGAAAPRSRPAPPRAAPAARPQTPAARPGAPARPPRPPHPAPPRSAPRGLAAGAPATTSVGVSIVCLCCRTAHQGPLAQPAQCLLSKMPRIPQDEVGDGRGMSDRAVRRAPAVPLHIARHAGRPQAVCACSAHAH